MKTVKQQYLEDLDIKLGLRVLKLSRYQNKPALLGAMIRDAYLNGNAEADSLVDWEASDMEMAALTNDDDYLKTHKEKLYA